jgi:cytoskeletal protein RodZ
MYIVLLALGVIVTVAGGGMTLFGVANGGFEIGNIMISAGMTGLVGGLIVIALANLARELRATRQPDARKSSRPAAPAAAAGRDTPAEKTSPATAGAADLSQVLAEPPAEPAPAEPRVEPTPPAPPPGDPFAPARADPQRRAAGRERSFDAVWAPEPTKPAPAAARPAPEPARESEQVALRPPREPQAVSVLKSGVIEGMAYTLYSDGSIEADLPQGMMRFPSIDALRRHLAGQG